MTYTSPLEDFHSKNSWIKYEGTLREVLDDLRDLNPIDTALHAGRIIRAVLDYKIQHDKGYDLILPAVDTAVSLYLGEGLQGIEKLLNSDLLDIPIEQEHDSISAEMFEVDLSKRTAENLREKFEGSDLLFIPLGHGGVVPGLDVFLHYCDGERRHNSFYPVRFSREKMGDKEPRLSPEEKEYLRTIGSSREVVIFDEDVCSGETINQASIFFTELFGRKVHCDSNEFNTGHYIKRKKITHF